MGDPVMVPVAANAVIGTDKKIMRGVANAVNFLNMQAPLSSIGNCYATPNKQDTLEQLWMKCKIVGIRGI